MLARTGRIELPRDDQFDVLGAIEEATDSETASKIAEVLGGTEITLSPRPYPDSLLSQWVGVEIAAKIGRHLGRGKILIPMGRAFQRERLRAAIIRLAGAGIGRQEIARRLRCHVRTVHRHLAAGENKAAQ
jgi:hypothetical protein